MEATSKCSESSQNEETAKQFKKFIMIDWWLEHIYSVIKSLDIQSEITDVVVFMLLSMLYIVFKFMSYSSVSVVALQTSTLLPFGAAE